MHLVDALFRDVRHAVRVLLKAPGFSLAAITTLALGIGANAAIFTLVRTVILRPLPYGDPHKLVMVWNAADRQGTTWLSLQEVVSYREGATSLADLAAYVETNSNLTGGQEPERVRAASVTPNLFDTLAISAQVGRVLTNADGDAGAPAVAVLGHGLWHRRFGGSRAIIGQAIQVDGQPRTIIGVTPAEFRLPLDYRARRDTDLLIPLTIDRANLGQWGNRSYFGVARLAVGFDAASASRELALIARRWVQAGLVVDNGDGGLERSAIPLQELITGSVRRPLLVLFGAVGIVLLIACANVVNLLLAKADVRRRDVAIRTALGAGRGHIVRQLLTESLLLSTVGGIAALGITQVAVRTLIVMQPASLPRIGEAGVDVGVLAFTMALVLLTTIAFGAFPAAQLTRSNVAGILQEVGRGGTAGRARLAFRRALVIAQLACAVVLVVGAGLLVRSLVELNRIDLGFDPRRILTAQIQLPAAAYTRPAEVVGFFRALTERVENLPGVTAVGAVRVLPLARTIGNWSITIQGRPLAPQENPNGDFQAVTPGYFAAMRTPLVRGRFLTAGDREDAPPAVVINEPMANRYWPGQDAIGRQFRMGGPGGTQPFMTVVGIVGTSRHNAVVEAPRAEMYLPHAQLSQSLGSPGRGMTLVVKTMGDPLALADPLRAAVREIDRNLPMSDVRSMEAIAAEALAGPRFATALLATFAVLAMVLASIGIYGTISLLVSERAHEIGIRLALGAGQGIILKGILMHGLSMAASGIALGLVAALLVTRLLDTLIYGVGALDPVTFAIVPCLLFTVALVACLLPARRAAAIDPALALRQ